MKLLVVTFVVVVAVNCITLTELQCKRRQRFWRRRCIPNGWDVDIPESCKPEMDNKSEMTKRRLKKCTRIQNELKESGQAYCWPVDCSEELIPTDEPVEPTEPKPTPEELCKKAKDTFDARECGNVLCDAEQNDEQCSNALEKLTSDCSFSFDCPPTPEELCKKAKDTFDARECGNVLCDAEQNDEQCSNALQKLTSDCSFSFDCPPTPEELCDAAMGLFKDRNCGDVLCSDEDDAQCSEALLKLTSDCGFAFDCPEPNPESGKLPDGSLVLKMDSKPECRKLCAGQTSGEGWVQRKDKDGKRITGAYIDISTEECGFVYDRKYPDIVTSITAPEHRRQMYIIGSSAVYRTSNDKIFRVYIRLNPEDNKDKGVEGIDKERRPTDTYLMAKDAHYAIEWIASGFIC